MQKCAVPYAEYSTVLYPRSAYLSVRGFSGVAASGRTEEWVYPICRKEERESFPSAFFAPGPKGSHSLPVMTEAEGREWNGTVEVWKGVTADDIPPSHLELHYRFRTHGS